MTETEWLAATHPDPMLLFLRGKATDRKLRLFIAACCRRVVQTFLDDEEEWRVDSIDVGERYADGLADEDEREKALGDASDGRPDLLWDCCTNLVLADFVKEKPDDADGIDCAIGAAFEARTVAVLDDDDLDRELVEAATQAGLVRDIFGPLPFRKVVVPRAWRTELVETLARAAYAERELPAGTLDPERLGVLADALEDAGGEGDILAHLREPAPRYRGDWVLDLLLGKR